MGLLTYRALKDTPLPKSVLVRLPKNEIDEALKKDLTTAELNVVRYMGGYFYGKLVKMHKKEQKSGKDLLCDDCASNGRQFTHESHPQGCYETYLQLKRYNDSYATLYVLNKSLEDLVIFTMKVTNHVFEKFVTMNSIVKSITDSVLFNIPPSISPRFCSEDFQIRFVRLVSKTVLTHKVKCLNKQLQMVVQKSMSRKRPSNGKTESTEKLRKITHN